jgi:hypothetical protein
MPKYVAFIAAECRPWPSKEHMRRILGDAGLKVDMRRYSIRVEDGAHISFEHYGGDFGDPTVEAHGGSEAEVLRGLQRICDALTSASVVHSFTVYDENENPRAHYHYE